MSTVKNPTFTFDLTQIQMVSFQCNQLFILNHKNIKYGLKIILKYEVSADIQYFAVSNRVYFLSNNVGIHFVFTYYFPMHPFRLVLMFSGITPLMKYKHIILLTHSIMTHNGPIFFFIRFIIFFVIDVIYYFFMTVMGENWCSSL